MKRILAITALAVAVVAPQAVRAEDKVADVTDMDALRTAVRADKKALVAAVLKLTPAEAKKFWPVYDAYQRDLDAANRRRTVVIEAIVTMERPLSNLYAKNLTNELIAADEAELKARRTLHNRLIRPVPGRTIMPAAKAARYLQLESKVRALQAYDIASTIPLVK
jgi:Spy/CpxP family protein refolding chaperone